jgi:NodT family efflux transporter outer membrane factor (OMF) lipoprotein
VRARQIWLISLCVTATACTVGPDYRLPEHAKVGNTAANGAFTSGNEAVFADKALPDHWWKLYDDARLDAYIDEAFAANDDLRAADANLLRAAYVVQEAIAGQLPVTTVTGSVGFARPPLTTEGFPGSAAYAAGVSLAFPLDAFGGIRREIEAARANAGVVQAARDDVRVTVAAAVTRSYVAVCSANRTLASTQRVLDVEQSTLSSTQRLFLNGRNTAFDVTRAQAAVDQSAAAIPPVLANRKAAVYELAALLGRVPENYPKEVESCATPPPLVRQMPVGDGAALIRRRADIREAERKLAAATASIGVATAQLYPQISFGGSVGTGGVLSAFGSNKQLSFSFGPLMTWTFPNRAIAHARISEAGAQADQASANFDGVVVEALRQTETALDDYAREFERNRRLKQARDSAAQALDQANRLFRFGRTDFLSVLSAQAALADSETTLSSSDAALIDKQIGVFLALGGGWDGPDTKPDARGENEPVAKRD